MKPTFLPYLTAALLLILSAGPAGAQQDRNRREGGAGQGKNRPTEHAAQAAPQARPAPGPARIAPPPRVAPPARVAAPPGPRHAAPAPPRHMAPAPPRHAPPPPRVYGYRHPPRDHMDREGFRWIPGRGHLEGRWAPWHRPGPHYIWIPGHWRGDLWINGRWARRR